MSDRVASTGGSCWAYPPNASATSLAPCRTLRNQVRPLAGCRLAGGLAVEEGHQSAATLLPPTAEQEVLQRGRPQRLQGGIPQMAGEGIPQIAEEEAPQIAEGARSHRWQRRRRGRAPIPYGSSPRKSSWMVMVSTSPGRTSPGSSAQPLREAPVALAQAVATAR